MADPILEVDDLRTHFFTRDGVVRAVDGVSWQLHPGETLGVVGESGCGKSITALSILRLIPMPPGRFVSGGIRFEGRDLLTLGERAMRALRGNDISMIFQEPMTSLNPVLTIGRQIAETLALHQGLSRRRALERAAEMLELVRIPEARRRLGEYPHQLSGGQRQRVMIAIALACNPKILIADEPTTALDVTIQAQILQLMLELKERFGTAIVLITHDLGVIAETAQRVVVMYAGRKVEEAPVKELFRNPRHPYTRGLMASVPRLERAAEAGARPRLAEIPGMVPSLKEMPQGCTFASAARSRAKSAARPTRRSSRRPRATSPPAGTRISCRSRRVPELLEVEGLTKHFPVRHGVLSRVRGWVRAVDGISFTVGHGETLGLVGESGCGKSTAGKTILRLIEPTAGSVRLEGQEITGLGRRAMHAHRRHLQVIFQDPYASLNPRQTAGDTVGEPLANYGIAKGRPLEERVAALFERVGLRPEQMGRYPHEFSGGQRQRLGIARALAVGPKLIVCDEPVSALDVSVQAQVINLLVDLQDELRLSYLFIAHDLAVVEHISHRVAVMYLGEIVELASRAALFANPLHPYTEALLAAVPVPDPERPRQRLILGGEVPSPSNPPAGCRFHTRCPYVMARCRSEPPRFREVTPGHFAACHLRD